MELAGKQTERGFPQIPHAVDQSGSSIQVLEQLNAVDVMPATAQAESRQPVGS